jgi:outer membrane protein OmpA-like peptidoglycan-associated protein
MALSKKNPSGLSQLEGLVDLLVELKILNFRQEPSKQPPSSEEEVKERDESLDSQSVEKNRDSYPTASPLLEPESTQQKERERAIEAEETAKSPSKPEQLTSKSTLSEADFEQTENVVTPPEPLQEPSIQSQLQEERQEELASHSLPANGDTEIDDSLDDFERFQRLQRLLLTPELLDSHEEIVTLKKKLENLEHQIYEPTELIHLLVPLVAQILSIKVAEAREEVAQAIASITDEMIHTKAQQDKGALSAALAPVLPDAVAQQVSNSPGEFAKALAPEMGTAIKEQIILERDAMVDALYPVIGNTISKYMAEAIKSINEKVENTLSLEGVFRKIRARIQGVSEAELIFKEAMPFAVQAIFLIHKRSGLVISEVQQSGNERLESEMIAGMLTAIRSFVNDCIAQSGDVSEIDQIEYGNSKIVLEVAGYCYLAVVIQGEPPKSFIEKMRQALGAIVQRYGKPIESFDGDPANVPEPIHPILESLTNPNDTSTETQKTKPPTALLLIGLVVLSAIFLPWGIYHYRTRVVERVEEKTRLALASDPELALYGLTVDADKHTLTLSGRLPNQYLRSKAEQIAKTVEPQLKINNSITAVQVPADPVLAAAEVKRVASILNQMDGTAIGVNYREGNVAVEGSVIQIADAKKITQAFERIPGVKSVTNTVQLKPQAIASRIYFDLESSQLKWAEFSKVTQIKAFLDRYPTKQLKLSGYSDRTGNPTENQRLALERAKTVRDALVTQGIELKRLQVVGETDIPPGVDEQQPPWLSRCVEFETLAPS